MRSGCDTFSACMFFTFEGEKKHNLHNGKVAYYNYNKAAFVCFLYYNYNGIIWGKIQKCIYLEPLQEEKIIDEI